jgi:hypothetical protein
MVATGRASFTEATLVPAITRFLVGHRNAGVQNCTLRQLFLRDGFVQNFRTVGRIRRGCLYHIEHCTNSVEHRNLRPPKILGASRHDAVREVGMLFPWYAALMLALESNCVIGLRLTKLAGGGSDARDEVLLMMNEKVKAAFEIGKTLMEGGTLFAVIDHYREYVAANNSRLAVNSRVH